jgi:hypothetical protein
LISAQEFVGKINAFYKTTKAIFTDDSGDYSKSFQIIQDKTDEHYVVVIASAGDLVRCGLPPHQTSVLDQTHS